MNAVSRGVLAAAVKASRRLRSFVMLSALVATAADSQRSADYHSLQIPEVAATKPRPITPKDLALLRDIDTFSLSPDGKFLAINVRQAVLETNSYRTAWFVASTSLWGRPHNVADAGEAQMVFSPDESTSGEFQAKPAQWSPDSMWIAYLVKINGVVQVWRSRRDGNAQEQVSHNPANVVDFMWSSDGSRIYLSVEGRTREEILHAEREEARHGFLLDERFHPGRQQSRPTLARNSDLDKASERWGRGRHIWVCDIARGIERLATTSDFEGIAQIRTKTNLTYMRLADELKLSIPSQAKFTANQRYVTWLDIARRDDMAFYPELRVFAAESRSGGDPIPCTAEPCTGRIQNIWWSGDDKEVVFDRAEGVNHASHALYAWSPLEGRVRKILFTNDLLLDCTVSESGLVCLRESPTTPRHVVSISLADGVDSTLFDPNPEFHNIKFGEAERLEWTNEFGHSAFGYFLKPLNYVPEKKYPLVVVTYRASGFLRGGVGDEYPAHVFAANGIGVLCFDKPQVEEYLPPAKGVAEIMHALDHDLLGLRSEVSSLEKGLSVVEESRLVDSNRIALTGLSAGAEIGMHSLLYGKRNFAAAILSSTSWDPIDFYISPDDTRKLFVQMGRGVPEGPDGGWWRKVSPALNVDKIHTPILMNVADRELIWSIQTISSMKEHRKPLEVFVYPDEWHVKGWPSHRYAIYLRNIDWLNFWLKDQEDTDPLKAEEYARWRGLRNLQKQNYQSGRLDRSPGP